MPDLNTPEIKFALQAVRQAAQLIREVQAELVSAAMTKDDRSPVTVADYASQALVARLLSQAFPDDPLVGEEDAAGLRLPEARPTLEQVTRFVGHAIPAASAASVCDWIDRGGAEPARRFWTLDPIDGTKGFLRSDQYAVALALVIDGQVQVGVLGCPNLSGAHRPDMGGEGSLVVAARGQGAWTTSLASPARLTRLQVSTRADPAQARLLRSFESGHTNVSQIDEFAQALAVQAEPVRMDSQAKYALLASGQGDLLLRLLSPAKPDYREKIWDQAAGSLVVEEAGGRISDLHGKALDFSAGRTLKYNRGVLASNGRLHEPALQTLQAIRA
ncbi:MAG TPA: 3'(2'),5'-bisphosphate nucleotidase [Burkholderiaceae bacterium]|nr:3'(2'),5'-bisphosphate nucleotidase [Anaerolineales bacterium]HSG20769.1 3'(2'),5'-bisphosphate nucleotidase [Burkholderiaceae bacterium]